MSSSTKKRHRENPTIDSERSAIFEDLAHENEEVRIKAAARLLTRLARPENSEELDYALKRLFRGLCSSRKAARLGFSVALTEILSQHARSKTPDTLKLLLELTKVSGQMTGQETRDYLMGRVFGTEAIVQSGILFQDESDQSSWKELIDDILTLAAQKPWLREECGWVCLVALQKLSVAGQWNDWADTALKLLVHHGLAKTPEGVALWVTANNMFALASKPSGIFQGDDPLAKKNWKSLLAILKEASANDDAEEDSKQAQRGSWSARPHFAWDIIFGALAGDQLARFWREIVDEGLFSTASSDERKHWGFSLFCQMLTGSPVERLPDLFNLNLCKCMSNHLAAKDRFLHLAAERSLKAIINRAESDPHSAGAILVRITRDDLRGIFMSGQLRTKVVNKLVGLIDVSSVERTVKNLNPTYKQILNASDYESSLGGLDILLSMIRTRSYPARGSHEYDNIRTQYAHVISSLVAGAYFTQSNSAKDPESEMNGSSASSQLKQTSDKFKSRLWTCLTSLFVKEQQPAFYPQVAVQSIARFEKESGRKPIADEAVTLAVKKARKAIKKLESSVSSTEKQNGALTLLLSLCIIQVYNGEIDALEALDDLLQCCEDLSSAASAEGQSRASDAIVEVLLSFVSKPPILFKSLAQQAFSMCTEIVTENGLESMMAVLEAKENVSGQNEMFETRDDDEGYGGENSNESEDEDDSEQESDSDVEMVDVPSENEETSEESGEDDAESGSDGDELDEFDSKLAKALGTKRADEDLAHGEDESSDSDMDDEQMEALDEHLSLIFKQRKQAEGSSKKKEKKDAKETITIFKSRVLDLLRIFVEQKNQCPLTLNILPRLLELIRTTRNKAVATKAADLVRDFSKHIKLAVGQHKGESNGKINSTHPKLEKKSKSLLKDVHSLALQQGSNQFQTACSHASLLLVKTYLSSGGEIEEVIRRYGKTQQAFLTDKNCGLKTSFFTEWMNWCAQARNSLSH